MLFILLANSCIARLAKAVGLSLLFKGLPGTCTKDKLVHGVSDAF